MQDWRNGRDRENQSSPVGAARETVCNAAKRPVLMVLLLSREEGSLCDSRHLVMVETVPTCTPHSATQWRLA